MLKEHAVYPTTFAHPGIALADNAPFDLEALQKAAEDKRVTGQRHPDYPYTIFKYSQQTTFSKDWDDVTMASRGLIVDDDGQIIARPFPKFFNYSEHNTPAELMTGPIVVAEKMDGSLGITFINPKGEMEISTAGGFQSPQAAWATNYYNENMKGKWNPDPKKTYLTEIVYPSNRIVVDYKNREDLVLLGAVDIKTGKSIPASEVKEWKWNRAEEFKEMTSLDSVLTAPERSNHEGYIVHFTDTDTRVKFKHEEYLRHHRFATGINSRRIWEMLRDGEDMSTWTQNAPEEFEEYITTTRDKIQKDYDNHVKSVYSSFDSFISKIPKDLSPRDYAAAVKATDLPHKEHFFTLRNTGKLHEGAVAKRNLWDKIKPDFEKSFWSANSPGNDE